MTTLRLGPFLVATALAGAPLAAQQPDRSHPPVLPAAPSLTLPVVQTATLPNGLHLATQSLPSHSNLPRNFWSS